MKRRGSVVPVVVACLALLASTSWAQDLGPHFRKIKEGIKRELRMPEYADWSYQERMPTNIEAAYRAVNGK